MSQNANSKDLPNPNVIHPIKDFEKEIYIKPTLSNPLIEVGEFSYIADDDFERHVTHHYDFLGDKLIIGKFVQIGTGVEFVMNGANHQLNAVSTYPFFTLPGWDARAPKKEDVPFKGDTVVGNDVWIGQNATIMPGIHIGDGAIIGASSVVTKDIAAYTVVGGNPAKEIRKRFDGEMIELLEKWQWWNLPVKDIKKIVPLLTNSNLEEVKTYIQAQI